MKLNSIIANANHNLSSITPKIQAATARAEATVNKKLKINHNINLIFAELDHFLIPEDGIGGRTYRADFILITLDLKKDPTEDTLFEIICHELCHAARWGANPEYMTTLFDGIINEGIATAFEEKIATDNHHKQVFLNTILSRSDAENQKLLDQLRPQLDHADYNYNAIFFTGNAELPKWTGYSIGYYLVKKYLSITNKTISQAFADNYANFKIALN